MTQKQQFEKRRFDFVRKGGLFGEVGGPNRQSCAAKQGPGKGLL